MLSTWMSSMNGADSGPAPEVPENLTPPSVDGILRVGETLTAVQGTWSNDPDDYEQQWFLDGYEPILGAFGSTYTMIAGQEGRDIFFAMTATNSEGTSAVAWAAPVGPIEPFEADTTPDAFELGGPYTGEPDEIIYSEENTLSGVDAATPIPFELTGVHGGCCRVETFNGSTWDNLGQDGDLYLDDVFRVRTRALEMDGDDFTLTLDVGGVTDTMEITTEVDYGTPDAPILTQASDVGGNPLEWSTEYTGVVIDHDEIYMRYRINGGSWIDEDAVLFDSDFYYDHIVDGDPYVWPLYSAELFEDGDVIDVEEGISRDGGTVVWSDTLSDTIDEVLTEDPTEWVSTNGTSKSQFITVNGTGNRTTTGPGIGFGGTGVFVRADTARAGKRQAEMVLGTLDGGDRVWFGVDDGTTNFNSAYPWIKPGQENSNGVVIMIFPNSGGDGYFTIYANGTNHGSTMQTISGGLLSTDGISVEYDTAAGTVSFYRTRSGVTTQFGTAVTGQSFTNWYAVWGSEDSHVATTTFGSGQQRVLTSGYNYYDIGV